MKTFFLVRRNFWVGVIFVLLPIFFFGVNKLLFCAENVGENDLLDLEKKCFDDDWSSGKKIILQNNLDLSKSKFKCLRIFNGEFDGQNYKISGLKTFGQTSNFGFFCCLGEKAQVKNLEVNVNFNANGTQKNIGGIAAKNFGLIENCIFNGKIKGTECIGGIVGINYGTGIISNCKSNGKIFGEIYVGGICGKNSGKINLCENNSYVNEDEIYIEKTTGDIDLKKIILEQDFVDVTDIGGIVGFSDGIVDNCVNNNQVGFKHTGYNIGGICGRQNNYVSNCINIGKVYGRKDIGGICGQTEPYRDLKYDEGILNKVSGELDKLKYLLKELISNSKDIRKDSLDKISGLHDDVDELNKSVKKMTDKTQSYVNKNVEKINFELEKISRTLDNVVPVLKKINKNLSNANKIFGEYKNALDFFDKAHKEIDIDNCLSGIKKFSDAFKNISDEMEKIYDLIDDIKDNLRDGSNFKIRWKNLKNILKNFDEDYENLVELCDELNKDFNKAEKKIANQDFDDKKNLILVLNNFIDLFEMIKNGFRNLKSDSKNLAESIISFGDHFNNLDKEKIKDDFKDIKKNLRDLNDNFLVISDGFNNFYVTMEEINIATGYLKDGIDCAKETTDKLRNEFSEIIDNFDDVIDEINKFISEPSLNLDKISNDFLNDKDFVIEKLNKISDVIFDLSNSLNIKQDVVNKNLNDVLEQVMNVFDSFKEKIDEQKNKSWNLKDYFEDISDIENDNLIKGKINCCVNKGIIAGDLNVGGIAGLIAFEYDFDREDDLKKENQKSLDFIYRARAIIKNCKNNGRIEAKKDYVGGIVGKAEIGAVFDSLSTGIIKSNDGNYVGGIVGNSGFLIKNCCAKVILNGKNYIGGIAGFGNKIFDCNSLMCLSEKDNLNQEVDFISNNNEFVGGIAGDIDDNGECKNCFFVGENFGGVNDINYKNHAERIEYEKFVGLKNLFDELKYLMVYFFDENELVKEIKINYGESLEKNLVPEIVDKKNFFGEWEVKNFDDLKHDYYVNAKYENYISAIECDLKRKNDLPVFVAEGKFNFDSELIVNELKKENDVELEKFEIEIKNNFDKKARVHYLIPEEYKKNKNVKLKILKDEKWEEKKFDLDGNYLVFEIDKPTEKIMLEKKIFWW